MRKIQFHKNKIINLIPFNISILLYILNFFILSNTKLTHHQFISLISNRKWPHWYKNEICLEARILMRGTDEMK